ncbi:glycosyltransferase [Maribellus maritimus]|uniref:glycosyltransferase n=1 Tax=Maribellus maritimus TaxID=2870838 RepID=UPI001EEBF18E|nr:glycosyltransferase [Maribellus maritimus]MCG6186091.1 glycosyltransferase [Maribellus maritimus]
MINDVLKVISEAEIFQIVLFFVLLTLILIQIIFKIVFFVQILRGKKSAKGDGQSPVSLLMAVRNEENNLSEKLPHLLELDRDNYEVIVVDDFSQDNTLSVLGRLKKENSKLKVSVLNQETRFSIKLSQNIALKSAKNDWVLFIPPSITQYHDNWLESISDSVAESLDVVVNYSNVCKNGKFFNKLYRIETFLLYLKSMKYSLTGFPIVYFENNVVFRKDKYFGLGGYGKKIKEPFANLELLINQFLSKKKLNIVLNSETSIRFSEKITRHDYFDLMRKSFRIEQHLSYIKRVLITLSSGLKLITLPLVIAVIFLFIDVWPFVSTGIGLLLILHLLIIKTMQNRLNERKIFITSLVYELIMPYYKIVFRRRFNGKIRRQNGRAKFKII